MRGFRILIEEQVGAPGFLLTVDEEPTSYGFESDRRRHISRSLGVEEMIPVGQLLDQISGLGRSSGTTPGPIERLIEYVIRDKATELKIALDEAKKVAEEIPAMEAALKKAERLGKR